MGPVPRAKKPKLPAESPRLPVAFDRAALGGRFRTVPRWNGLGSGWTRETVTAAVEAQARGMFRTAAPLGRAMLADPAIFAAALNRLAPHRGLKRQICGPAGAEGLQAAIIAEASMLFVPETSVALPAGVLADAFHELAFHELSVAQIQWEPRADGSRLDPFVSNFDLDAVEWVETDRKLYANTQEDGRVEIVHGDGRWIVFARASVRPWARAALLALGKLWPEMSFGRRDRSQNAESHGDDKWLGELPAGVAIDSPDGAAMLDELEALYQARRVMIRPSGSKVERSEAVSQNWQIFKELLESGSKDAQRVLLGQDGTMTNSGGNYIKSWGLFGVRNDIVESDLSTGGACLATGLIRPWSLLNFGRWDRLSYEWMMPDADEDARRASIAERRAAMWADISAARAAGAVVDQDYVDTLAREYGVTPARLPAAPVVAPSESAPTPAAIVAPRKALTAA